MEPYIVSMSGQVCLCGNLSVPYQGLIQGAGAGRQMPPQAYDTINKYIIKFHYYN